MKYGFTIPGSGPLTEPDTMSAVAKRGEELGYDLVVAPDHIVLPRAIDSVYPYADDGIHPGTRTGSCLEQLTVLSFIAGANIKMQRKSAWSWRTLRLSTRRVRPPVPGNTASMGNSGRETVLEPSSISTM